MNSMNRFQNKIQNGTADNLDYLLTPADSSKYDLKYLVQLPINEDPREWIAYNIFNFHKQICMLYGTINENCTADSCPSMSAGKKFGYLWSADVSGRESVGLCATQYIHQLLDWIQEQLDDETVFPTEPRSQDDGKNEFPPNYLDICKVIVKRLFRVYAHIYHHHMNQVKKLDEDAHMNTSLKHFTYFVQEFNLMTPDDLEPLKEYIQSFT